MLQNLTDEFGSEFPCNWLSLSLFPLIFFHEKIILEDHAFWITELVTKRKKRKFDFPKKINE